MGELTAEVGRILIAGPDPQNVACDLNIHCHFNITGNGLACSNQVFILELGEECGSIVGPYLPGLTNPVGRLVERFDIEFNSDFSAKLPNFRWLVLLCIEA